uniref:Pre-mRNA-splicing factor CWC26 n=1 Tax=Arcella intermedia TaxID=1963864 RepID=A0A6B2L883_9EUKA
MRKSKGDASPLRRSKGDASPPRRRVSSPPRKSNTDASPPRKTKGEVSPPRRRRDSSPPRKSQPDSSPKRAESPPRRYKVSPRRVERSKEVGPIIKEAKETSPPPWKDLTDNGGEEVPSRKRTLGLAPPEDGSKAKKMRVEEQPNSDKAKKGGLFTAAEMEVETQKKLKEASAARASMDPQAAGKGAETIYRDKKGRPLTMLNKMVNNTDEEQYEWGGGKKLTKEEDEEKRRFEEEQKGMPYRGATTEDEQLNEEYRNAVRFGDPMAELLAKKIKKRERKRMKKLGIVPKPVIPKKEYKGYCPPNRFGIKPGFEWDGIDRSNGYEKTYFERINERKAREDMEVRWAQEDL